MKLYGLRMANFGPFKGDHNIRFGNLPTIVGKNDTGKSHVLKALDVFFDDKKMDFSFINGTTSLSDPAVIEVSFTSLPDEIELENSVKATLAEEMLVDKEGLLRIRKVYSQENPKKPVVSLVVMDFKDDRFSGLVWLSEKDLNTKLQQCDQDAKKSGGGLTNKARRSRLRDLARDKGLEVIEKSLEVAPQSSAYRSISKALPKLILFASDTTLGVGVTSFQSEFRPVVDVAVAGTEIESAKREFMDTVDQALQGEINKIFEHMKDYTDEIKSLHVATDFSWHKAVTFDVIGEDDHDVQQSLERRGTGIRRLLMVSFFQYLAEKDAVPGTSFVFGVEEPENCLHPSLQRDLCEAFRRLSDRGYQVIMTSHSPVFAGASPMQDLVLITRTDGEASVTQAASVNDNVLADRIAEELGVEPADQITGYKACVFVEGRKDIDFFRRIATTLKSAGAIDADFDDAKVGFIMCGGADNLRHWVDLRALKNLNRRFGGVLDSDKRSERDNIKGRKLNLKKACEDDGGKVFILRKRTIENYIHQDALVRSGRTVATFGPYVDMKEAYGENVYKVVCEMTAPEILKMDEYKDNGVERHELKEIVETFLRLPDM